MNKSGPGTLKCVVFRADAALRQDIHDMLRSRVGADALREIDSEAILVFTEGTSAEIRDWVAALGRHPAWLLVLEFEKWSSYGPEIDRVWLLERGH
jgi:hypothetical protein